MGPLEFFLTGLSMVVIIFTNIFTLLTAKERLDRDYVYDKYLLRLAGLFYLPQIPAAFAIWHYSDLAEAPLRNVLLVWLVVLPVTGFLYCATRYGRTVTYGLFSFWTDMSGSILALLAMYILLAG